MLQGLFFGRTAPHRSERRTFETPALVIGHQHDIVHPFSDAGMLASELPNGRLVQASSILELRLAPERLTGEIARVHGRVLAPAAGQAAGRRTRQRRTETVRFAVAPFPAASLTVAVTVSLNFLPRLTLATSLRPDLDSVSFRRLVAPGLSPL